MNIYKTATTLAVSALIAYPFIVTLLNISEQYMRWYIDHGKTVVGFLPTHHSQEVNAEEQSDFVPQTSVPTARATKMRILHAAVKRIMNPLE